VNFLAQLHPPTVHFAIALTITGLIFEILSLIFKKESLKHAGFWTFIFGVFAVWGAVLTGHEAEEVVEEFVSGKAKELLETHEDLGEMLPYIITVVGIMRIYAFLKNSVKVYYLFLIAGIITVGLIGFQGNLGGKLVYEHGVGVKAKVENIKYYKHEEED